MGFLDTLGDIGSSLLDYTIGLPGKILDYNLNAHQQNKQNDFSLYTYRLQREDALADRQHLEEYNSPKNQMSLYREGGLNPNLAYTQLGSPTTVLPNKSTLASGAGYTPFKLGNPNLAITSAQLENIAADTKLKETQADLNKAKESTEKEMMNYVARKTESLSFDCERKGFESVYYEQMAYANWLLSGYKASTAGYISDYWKARANKAVEEVQAAIDLCKAQGQYYDIKAFAERAQEYLNYVIADYYQQRTKTEEQNTKIAEQEALRSIEQVDGEIMKNGILALTFERLQKIMPFVQAKEIIGIMSDVVDMATDIHPATRTYKSVK